MNEAIEKLLRLESLQAEAPTSESREEKRCSPRYPYRCRQLVSFPATGLSLRREDFSEADFRDISTGGFSFYWHGRLRSSRVVVALRAVEYMIFASAKVVYIRIYGDQHYVGCRFVERLGPLWSSNGSRRL